MKRLAGRYRIAILLVGIAFVVLCQQTPHLSEWYGRTVYPLLSAALSAFSSLFPFSLTEISVIVAFFVLIIYPIRLQKKGNPFLKVLFRQVEIFGWIYLWFYLAWGLNYYRYDIHTRLQTSPIAYEEARFKSFLNEYTEQLNATYQAEIKIDAETLRAEVGAFYTNLSHVYGLAKPRSWQEAKEFLFTPIYSKVSVLGSMGPFFAEAQMNSDLPDVQYPFTYAHEFSHLLGVSSEAEANYWAYRACTESSLPALQYCGHFGLLSYVVSNASRLLTEEDFEAWVKTIRPEIRKQYDEKNKYWREKYSPTIANIQDFIYNLYLKGNKIKSGKKNYAEVIGLLLSLPKEEK